MTLVVLLGIGCGLALWVAGLGLWRPRTDLAVVVGRWESGLDHAARQAAKQSGADHDAGHQVSWRERVETRISDELIRRGIELPNLRADLAVCGRGIEQYLASTLGAVAIGFLAPPVLTGLALLVGIRVPLTIPAVLAVALGGGLVVLSRRQLHDEAERRRADLRRALGSYLDLVAMSLAGGRGVAQALPDAAAIGRGWAFELIASTIDRSVTMGRTPWDALRDLGTEAGVPQLVELGSALALTGREGSRARESLAARAVTLRRGQTTDARGEANTASQSMLMGQLVLVAGFLVFLGFPAVSLMLYP